jgi:hypothetical protein
MNINIHINSQLGRLYGFHPVERKKSYNVTLNFPKSICRDQEKIRDVLMACGCDSSTLRKIMHHICNIEEDDDDIYYSKIMDTIMSKILHTKHTKVATF